jgi:hypothetical protein
MKWSMPTSRKSRSKVHYAAAEKHACFSAKAFALSATHVFKRKTLLAEFDWLL